jgi:hypothetical protein
MHLAALAADWVQRSTKRPEERMNTKRKLDLTSTYLSAAVLGAHTIGLHLAETDSSEFGGTVSLDPNRCMLDLWGEPAGCTKIATRSAKARATRMRTYDTHGHRRVHYAMSIGGITDAKIHLIEYPEANLWYLVVEAGEQGASMVPLFADELFRFDAVGTIQTHDGVPLPRRTGVDGRP